MPRKQMIQLIDTEAGIIANPASVELSQGDLVFFDRSKLKKKPVKILYIDLPSPANGMFLLTDSGELGLVMNNESKPYYYYAYYAEGDLLGDGPNPPPPPPPPNPPVIIIMDDMS